MGEVNGIEGGGADAGILRDLGQTVPDALVVFSVLDALGGIADASGQHGGGKAAQAHRRGAYQHSQPAAGEANVCQIHDGQVDQQGRGAKGILIVDAVLIGVVRHEIHQQIGNQQDIPLIPPGQQRQPQQRPHGQCQHSQLFRLHAFIHGFHGAHDHRLHQSEQGRGIVKIEVFVAVGHHALAVAGQIGGDRQEPSHGAHQNQRAQQKPLFLRICAPQQRPRQPPQGHHRHIHCRVFLDRQGQQGGCGGDGNAANVHAIEQPQQQGREEAVFVQVITGPAGVGGEQKEQRAHQHPGRAGEPVPPGDLPGGDHRRGQHRRLKHLQGGRVGGQREEGEHQVVHRGYMHREMGHQPVPLQRGQRRAGGAHIVKHLAENAEIIAGRAEAVDPSHRPQAVKQQKAQRQQSGKPGIKLAVVGCFDIWLRAAIPAPDPEAQGEEHQQHTCPQQRPAEAGQRSAHRQRTHPQQDPAPLRLSRGYEAGHQAQPAQYSGEQRQRQPKGHPRQRIHPGQIPQGPGQQEILKRRGQHPGGHHPADQAGNAPCIL